MIQFQAFNPFINQMRTDKGWRVTFDVTQDQYHIIQELPNLQEDRMLVITVQVLDEEKPIEETDEETRGRFMRMLHAQLAELADLTGETPEEERQLLKKKLIKDGIIEESMKELTVEDLALAISWVKKKQEKHARE